MTFSNTLKLSSVVALMAFSLQVAAQETQNMTSNSTTTTTAPNNTMNGTTTSVNQPTTTTTATTTVVPTPAEDAIITKSIKALIDNSKTLKDLNIGIQTTQGVVTLSGNVDSDSQASMLIELAQSVIGVTDVDASKLVIKDSQQPFADMLITAKIKGLFIREKVFGDKDIAAVNMSVETNNGVVYLTGQIDNQEQVKNAIKIIEGVSGVKRVEYNVKKITPINNTSDNVNGTTTSPSNQTTSTTNSY